MFARGRQFYAVAFSLLLTLFCIAHFRFSEHELQVDCPGTANVLFKIKLNLSPKKYLVSVSFVVPFLNTKQDCIGKVDPSCFLLGKCWKSENSQDRLRGDLHKVRHSSRFCLVTDLLRLFFLLQRYRQTVALSNVDLAKIYTQSTIEVYRRGVIDWVIYQPRSQGSLLLALRSERERERTWKTLVTWLQNKWITRELGIKN